MIVQQVNLYTHALRPQRDKLPLWALVAAALVLGVVLTGVSLWNQRQLTELTVKLAHKQSQADALTTQVATLSEQVSGMRRDESLEERNQRLRERVAVRQELLKTLGSAIARSSYRFSELMFGFARQIRDDVWLTRFGIDAGGGQIRFSGVALLPESVPAFLQRLRSEGSFGGRNFQLFSLEPNNDDDKGRAGIRFTVASVPDEPGQDVVGDALRAASAQRGPR